MAWIDRNYLLILCSLALLSVSLAYIYFTSGNNNPYVKGGYFYQDLNSVEVRFGEHPVDPKVIASIHHWQKNPFGVSPLWEGLNNLVSSLVSALKFYVGLLFLLLLIIIFK